jgi:DNA-binding NtrC family response regulator
MPAKDLVTGRSSPSNENGWPEIMAKTARRSILVVDDEENFLALLRWFLTSRGYEVDTALNRDAAVRLTQARTFDLAFIDIRLGQVDGLTLVGELKLSFPSIKIVMMTAYPTIASIKKSLEIGASAFLTKPIDLQRLIKTIQGLL